MPGRRESASGRAIISHSHRGFFFNGDSINLVESYCGFIVTPPANAVVITTEAPKGFYRSCGGLKKGRYSFCESVIGIDIETIWAPDRSHGGREEGMGKKIGGDSRPRRLEGYKRGGGWLWFNGCMPGVTFMRR